MARAMERGAGRIRAATQRSELAGVLWSLRREFAMVAIFSMLTNLLLLVPTLYMLQIFDRVMVSRNQLTLLFLSLITLFLLLVMAFSEWTRSKVLVRTGMQLDNRLGPRVFQASFASRLDHAGTHDSRAFSDLLQLRQFLTGNGIFALFDAPWTPIYLAVLFFLHPWLGILALGFALVQVALVQFGHRRSVAPTEAANQANADARAYLHSKLRNVEVLESMGMLQHLRPRWLRRHREALARLGAAQALTHRITAWSKFVRYSQQSLGLGAGALLVINGHLSPGEMIAANVLMTRTLTPIDQLAGTWRDFITARGGFARLQALLHTHPARDATLARTDASRVEPGGRLCLHDVQAVAPGRAQPLLQDINLVLEPGTVTIILGASGAGKSTLARCMVGVWPGRRGAVLLDGRPLEHWRRADLGPRLGYLPQDIELFEGTIAENVARFGAVDPDKVIAATRSAGLHEMVLHLPGGYDTPVGEAGALLSSGQRQRIGLARAIYGHPVLVVLDEPNSHLDEAGEAALVRVVRELRSRRSTVVLVTHRPGIVAVADRVIVLHGGRVQADEPRDAVIEAQRPAPMPPPDT
ncbi:type I secretion system permease/ATPase [Comamonas antarctica]|uniref:type I secretion system permease/ATPase n=1 Tax=Comamonas antarctica TaxID=2743470 RepID=UPI0028F02E35|nr:type I secretion system permease/ATPase [Comamonas antarctica]